MQSVLQLFVKNGATIMFVVLEILCLFLIVNYNQSQKSIFLNSTKLYSTSISEQVQSYTDYLDLKTINDSLSVQQALDMSTMVNNRHLVETDSVDYRYKVVPAMVVKNSSHRRNNTLTINKGTNDGILPGMGVISRTGIVGIVNNVSARYSLVNSVLHSQSRISCTVKPYLYPGNLVWKESNPNFATLEAIPNHLSISAGDTIATNGFSTIFPKDINVGVIEEFKPKHGTGTHDIKVRLNNKIEGEKVVYVIIDKDVNEINLLEDE